MDKNFDIEMIKTNSGDMTVKVNGFLLHSKYDPKKEASQLVEKSYKPNSLHILFGYGLGYFVNALYEKLSESEDIIVIDPLYDLLNKEINSAITIIKDVDDENFKKVLTSKMDKFNRRVHMIQSPNYDKIISSEYKSLLEIVNEKAKLNRVNENTIRVFAEVWQRNYLLNLYNAVGDRSLSELKKKYDIPVVIASGGPSLTKQLNLLSKIKENVLIIAAGSTINTLLSSNIVPDFVVSIDGLVENYNHFKKIHSKEITYIYSLTSHYGIRESFEKPAYLFNTPGKSQMKNHFEKISKLELPVIAGGGTVANFAFTIATFISTGPIAMIGQDLAYTDNKTHAENNNNFKIVDEEYQKARGMFLAEGYYGDKVLTDYVFLSMKESFENLISLVGDDRIIFNCTEGGINIKGFNQLSFKNFCDKFVDNLNKSIYSANSSTDIKEKRNSLIVQMRNELNIYAKIRRILTDNLKTLSGNKLKTVFSEITLKKLNRNDKKLKNFLKDVSMESIVDPITINIQNNYLPSSNETAEEAYQRVYFQNKELYSKLIDALDLTVCYTEELITKTNLENEVI